MSHVTSLQELQVVSSVTRQALALRRSLYVSWHEYIQDLVPNAKEIIIWQLLLPPGSHGCSSWIPFVCRNWRGYSTEKVHHSVISPYKWIGVIPLISDLFSLISSLHITFMSRLLCTLELWSFAPSPPTPCKNCRHNKPKMRAEGVRNMRFSCTRKWNAERTMIGKISI